MIRKLTGLSLAAGVLLLGACHDDGTLEPPATPAGGALMSHYVAMGNSITAGYQSAGINDSTQKQSYAHLLAVAAGAPYYYQSLQGRGCAPPFVKNAANPQVRVGGTGVTATTCDLVAKAEHPWLTNVAVPGARAIEMTDNFAVPTASNTLTSLILGGETQAQRMAEGGPTLVTMWAGNNDVLGALTNASNPGVPAAITSSGAFNTAYDAALDAITATGADALVIGVVDVTNIPYTSQGLVIFCAKNPGVGGCPGTVGTSALPPTFTVNPNCAASLDSILVPWSTFVPLIGAAALGATTTLDCSVDTKVVTPTEYAALRNAVVAYNAHIVTAAAAHGFAYWDPNPTLLAKKAAGQIPVFPDLSQLATGVVTFGPYFTLDGVHPSALAHVLIADSLAARLNSAFGTTIPAP
jgi:lysophospholipase L1-like esterase